MNLKQVAVYYPSGSSKSKARRSVHERRHGHADFHKHNKEVREAQEAAEKRDVGDMVTATIDGQVVSWTNMWDGHGVATPAAGSGSGSNPGVQAAGAAGGLIGNVVESIAAVATGGASWQGSSSGSGSGSGSSGNSGSSSSSSSGSGSAGDWSRTGYYDSDSQTADGIAFLNNMGGQGSGVFDNVWGNSLSYAASNAQSGAASPEVLNATLPSNTEVIIFSGSKCASGDADCGYGRPGTVMHRVYSSPDGDR